MLMLNIYQKITSQFSSLYTRWLEPKNETYLKLHINYLFDNINSERAEKKGMLSTAFEGENAYSLNKR